MHHSVVKRNSEIIYFVAAGRLTSVKGFDLMIEAIAMLNDLHIHLDILGEGILYNELKQQIQTCGVEDKVSLVGFQQNPYAWFSSADGFLLSSRYEAFPNVVLEALTCGTPVIAMPAPYGIKEITQ